ncbi:Lrp/AsnC family transcriptional regulator [Vineibacter terrae]|nr:Lrp/AsnC family transcriptional regulator [Vineibacter terrae]
MRSTRAPRQRSPGRAGTAMLSLDRIDIRILSILQREGRISKSALAERVGLSPSACVDRISRLERAKVIASYHAHVDLRALFDVQTFFMTVTLRSHRASDFAAFEAYVQKVPQIIECYALGGGIDYLLKVMCQNVDSYQALVERLLEAQPGVDRYFTYIMTKAIKAAPQPPVDVLVEMPGARRP